MLELVNAYMTEANNAFELNMVKIDAVVEAAKRELDINHSKAEFKVIQEAGTMDDLKYLYEEADNGLVETLIKAIKKIKDSIIKFFSDMKDKIITIIHKKENEETIKKIEKKTKIFPLLGRKKILIENYEEEMKVADEAIADLTKLKAKSAAGQNVTEEDVDKVEETFMQKHGKIIGISAALAITVSGAIVLLKKMSSQMSSTIQSLESDAKKDCDDCEKIVRSTLSGDGATVHSAKTTQSILRALTSIRKTMATSFVRAYTSIGEAVKGAIKSMKNTKVDASLALEENANDDINMGDIEKDLDTSDTSSNDAKIAEEDGHDDPADTFSNNTDTWDNIMKNISTDDNEGPFDSVLGDEDQHVSMTEMFNDIMNSCTSVECEPCEESTFDSLMSSIDDLF